MRYWLTSSVFACMHVFKHMYVCVYVCMYVLFVYTCMSMYV